MGIAEVMTFIFLVWSGLTAHVIVEHEVYGKPMSEILTAEAPQPPTSPPAAP